MMDHKGNKQHMYQKAWVVMMGKNKSGIEE